MISSKGGCKGAMWKFYTFKLNGRALTARLLTKLELPKWDGGCMQHESYFIIIPNDKSKGGLQSDYKNKAKTTCMIMLGRGQDTGGRVGTY